MTYSVTNATAMNNKQAIIWILVAILVMGASLWYVAGTSSSGNNMASTTAWIATTTGETDQTPGGTTAKPGGTTQGGGGVPVKTAGSGPLTYLRSLKQDWKCSVSTTGVTTKRTGTVYVSNGQTYGIFTGLVNGKTTIANMIDDGTYLYVWTAGSTTGFKGLAATSANGSVVAMRGGVDPAQTLSYTCNPWTPDLNLLAVPTTVTFTNQ